MGIYNLKWGLFEKIFLFDFLTVWLISIAEISYIYLFICRGRGSFSEKYIKSFKFWDSLYQLSHIALLGKKFPATILAKKSEDQKYNLLEFVRIFYSFSDSEAWYP